MRRKLSKLLLMITVVCMSVMTLVLAACSNTGNEPQKPAQDNTKVNTVTMLKDVISNLKASYALDKTFGIDVAAKYLQDDKNDDTEDAKFELIAKGNVDVNDDANENATNFVIELNKVGAESKETMFGIAYEVIDGKPYFFVNLLNGGYEKINGFSILSLYKMANAQVAGGAGGINIESLIAYVAPILFGDTGKVDSGVYTFNFDLANLVNEIEGFIPLLTGALNMSTEDLDSLVAIFCKNMTFSSGEAVDSLADLVDYVNTEMSFSGTIAVKFDANKKFTSSSLTFDYANGDEGKTYTFSVDKAFVGTTNTPIDTFNGFALTEDARKQNQAYNLLNFSLDGTATGIDKEDNVKHTYTISVDSDIDPFVFFGLLESTSKEKIVECLKAMGYFHLVINEGDKNIVTIHTKSSEGYAVIMLDGYNTELLGLEIMPALGGVYEYDALIDVIGMLTAPKGAAATADGGMNIGAILAQMLGFINADNMQENGVTIELQKLVTAVIDMLAPGIGGMVGPMLLPGLLGGDQINMNIKLQTPIFGECETVATDTIVANLREHKDFAGTNKDLIKEVTSLGIDKKLLLGVDINSYFNTKKIGNSNKVFDIKGKNLKGEPVDTLGFIMATEGLDINKIGKQQVTFYISIATDIIAIDGASVMGILDISLDNLLPLYGVIKYTTEMEVVSFDAYTKADIEGDIIIGTGSSLKDTIANSGAILNVNGVKMMLNKAEYMGVFDENGEDVSATVLDKKGNLTKAGKYSVKFKLNNLEVSKNIVVVSLVDNNQGKVTLGGNFVDPTVMLSSIDNQSFETNIKTLKYKVGYSEVKSEKLFDIQDATKTIRKDLAYANQKLTVIATVECAGKEFEIQYVYDKIESPATFTKFTSDRYYMGMSVNGQLKITFGKDEYIIAWDKAASKWVAKTKDNKSKEIKLSLKWKDQNGTDVQVNEYGVLVNYDFVNRTKIYYKLECENYYIEATASLTAFTAPAKYSHKLDSTLDGYISYIDQIYHEKNGEKVEVEFKYGKDGYAIYEKGTDNKVYDVTVKVTKDNQEVQLVDGKFTETGKYKVEYELNINGVVQKVSHNVTVK